MTNLRSNTEKTHHPKQTSHEEIYKEISHKPQSHHVLIHWTISQTKKVPNEIWNNTFEVLSKIRLWFNQGDEKCDRPPLCLVLKTLNKSVNERLPR